MGQKIALNGHILPKIGSNDLIFGHMMHLYGFYQIPKFWKNSPIFPNFMDQFSRILPKFGPKLQIF